MIRGTMRQYGSPERGENTNASYRIERCCEDLTHETFYVLRQQHFVAVCPTKQGAIDLVRALNDGEISEDLILSG